MLAEQGYLLSEISRRMTQLIRIGRIYDVDYRHAKVKVKIGENITSWRPWISLSNAWVPPKKDEQVVLLSPNGDFEQGIVLPALYYTQFPAPSDKPNETKLDLSKDNAITFDENRDQLTIKMSEEGNFVINFGEPFNGKSFFAVEKEGVFFKDGQFKLALYEGLVSLKDGEKQIKMHDDRVLITNHGSQFAVQKDRVSMQVGTMALELNPSGLFLNGLPITPGI